MHILHNRHRGVHVNVQIGKASFQLAARGGGGGEVALLEVGGLEVDGVVQTGLMQASLDLQSFTAFDMCHGGRELLLSGSVLLSLLISGVQETEDVNDSQD